MYKKQLGFQKLICYLGIVAAALWFVYSLGMITDIYEALSPAIRDPNKLDKVRVPGAALYYEMQPFNSNLTYAGIAMILISCLLFVTNTHTRRRYYIANFFSVGVYSAASVALYVWAHQNLAFYTDKFLTTVDFEKLAKYAETMQYEYTTSTWLLDAHNYLGIFSIVVSIGLIANLIWKVALMRGERKLIEAGKEVA